jgi:hypothetical protein
MDKGVATESNVLKPEFQEAYANHLCLFNSSDTLAGDYANMFHNWCKWLTGHPRRRQEEKGM